MPSPKNATGEIIVSKKYSKQERMMLKAMIKDYLLFGLPTYRIKELIQQKTGLEFSMMSAAYMVKQVQKESQITDDWLDEFARSKLADFYRERIDKMQYLENQLLLLLSKEIEKKDNAVAVATISKVIIETDKVLSEYALAPPVISKIKSLIPLDITEYSNIEQKATTILKEYETEGTNNPDIPEESSNSQVDTGIPRSEDDDNAVF